MTRLSDYLRAERPDETEPASFYVPGAPDWLSVHKGKHPARPTRAEGGDHEAPLDTQEDPDIDDIVATQAVATFKHLED